jgi:glycosyltransferase involved in cell wall biosynthesis
MNRPGFDATSIAVATGEPEIPAATDPPGALRSRRGAAGPIRSIAVVTSEAYSLANFRGPLIRELVRRGITVYALAADFRDDTREAVARLGAVPVDISLNRTGLHPLRDLVDLARLALCLRKLAPDVVLAYFIKPVIYGTLAAALCRVPHRFALVPGLGYMFAADEEEGAGSLLRRLVRLLYRMAFAQCDKVFLQNQEDLVELVRSGLLSAGKAVRVNGTGVELGRLRPAPAVLRPPTFLMMARLLKQKGVREFAAAAERVKTSHPDARFMLLGDVDQNPNSVSRSEVEGWVARGILEWPGQVSDVVPYIARSSVYVLPSYYREGVPRSTQEAMAMARPVITTDNTGCRETVIDGVNGFIVPVRDVHALADAMLRFIECPELIEPMGAESRRLVEERFDIDSVNDAMLNEMGIAPGRVGPPE